MNNAARNAKQLGAIIRRERKSRDLTQKQLGETIGLRQATISKLERGEPGTQLRTLFDALTALGLELRIHERGQGRPEDIETLF